MDKKGIKIVLFYITFAIFGPLFLFGGLGLLIKKYFHSTTAMLLCFLVAYIVSNVFMFRKLRALNKSVSVMGEVEKESLEKKESK